MNLIRTPDFSGVPRLEVLRLDGCSNLVGLHPSIGQLSKLKRLNLSFCKSLTNLPSLSAKMEPLTSIDLSNCSKIKKIPEFKGTMKSLSQPHLGSTAIEELPPSSIECLTALEILNLSGCSKLVTLPAISQLSKLEVLDLSNCNRLRSVSELPSTMRYINMENCCSLEPSPALLRQSTLSIPYSSPFFRGYDECSGGVAFTILNRYLQVISSFSLFDSFSSLVKWNIMCFFFGYRDSFVKKLDMKLLPKEKRMDLKLNFRSLFPEV